VSLRAAENKFTADVSTGKQRQVSPACQRFALRNTGTPELFHHDGEFASVVPERYRYQTGIGCELNLHAVFLVAAVCDRRRFSNLPKALAKLRPLWQPHPERCW